MFVPNLKTIFLDIDGVLNSEAYYKRRHITPELMNREYPVNDIDPEAVENLNTLLSDTGAKVVISSTWRLGRTVENLQNTLNKAGFKGEVIGKTACLRDGTDCILRGNEILYWVKQNYALLGKYYWEYKDYVIFDDDSDMLYWQKDNFIHVDRFVGLTKGTVFKARKILNRA